MMAVSIALMLVFSPLVTVEPTDEALRATFTLDALTTAYTFTPQNTLQRRDAWHPVGEGWTFDGRVLSREDSEEFSSFTLRLQPDPAFHDRHYVTASRVGEGWALTLAPFSHSDGPVSLRFDGFAPDTVLRLPGHEGGLDAPIETDGNDHRVAYLGPSAQVEEGSVTLIAGPELPEWVATALTRDADRVARVLERRLGAPAVAPPSLIVSYAPDHTGSGRKGGALAGATIRMNLADDLGSYDEQTAATLAGFTAHELVHLWLNEVWDTTENSEQPWLHEGAAEYIADRLTLEDDAFRREAAQHIESCLSGLQGRALDGSGGPLYGQVPYDCGFTLQLAAELASVAEGRGDILDLWRSITRDAPEGQYDSGLFLEAATERGGARFTAVSRPLLNVQGGLKALALGDALGALGIEIVEEPATRAHGELLLHPALMSFLRSQCRGAYGFWTEPDALRLSTDDRCGPVLSNGPVLTALNGISLTEQPYGAFTALREACAWDGTLTFDSSDRGTLAPLDCDVQIANPGAFATLGPLPALRPLRSETAE